MEITERRFGLKKRYPNFSVSYDRSKSLRLELVIDNNVARVFEGVLAGSIEPKD
jgi:hypothetical protein